MSSSLRTLPSEAPFRPILPVITFPPHFPLAYLAGLQSEGGAQPPLLLDGPWCRKEALQASNCAVEPTCLGTGPRHRIQSQWSQYASPQSGDPCWASSRSRPQGSELWGKQGEVDPELLYTNLLSPYWIPDPMQAIADVVVAASSDIIEEFGFQSQLLCSLPMDPWASYWTSLISVSSFVIKNNNSTHLKEFVSKKWPNVCWLLHTCLEVVSCFHNDDDNNDDSNEIRKDSCF